MTAPEPTVAVPARERSLPPEAYRRMTLVLRAGLLTALVLLVAGVIAYRFVDPSVGSGEVVRSNPIAGYLDPLGLAHGLAAGSVEAYLTLGLLALIATPILRVFSGFYYFRRGREQTMAAVTLTVFLLLLAGLFVVGPFLR